jgi:hypothetical protein
MTVETLLGSGGVALLGVVGYFLKKTHDKIDATAAAVERIGSDVDTRIDRLEDKLSVETKSARTEIIHVFQEVCHERQESCARLRDAKLATTENRVEAQCKKMQAIIADRDRKWEKQEALNEKFKSHIYKTKDGGSSWDLQNGDK